MPTPFDSRTNRRKATGPGHSGNPAARHAREGSLSPQGASTAPSTLPQPNQHGPAPTLVFEAPKLTLLADLGVKIIPIPRPDPRDTCTTDWRVLKLKAHVDKEQGRADLKLNDMCRNLALGISGERAGRLFRQLYGIGFREYARDRRLVKAAEQLAQTTLCVKTIAYDTGYQSTADFSRRFKKQFEMTPTEYRLRSHASPSANGNLGGDPGPDGVPYAKQRSDAPPAVFRGTLLRMRHRARPLESRTSSNL